MIRGAVLTGGGRKGSHQAGVCLYLGEHGHPGFEVITGTSVGGINGAGLAHFPPSQFLKGAQRNADLWLNKITGSKSIYKKKWFKYIRFVFSQLSLYNTSPILALLRDVIDPLKIKSSGVELRMTAYDLKTSTLKVFDQNTPDIVLAIMATSSFPIAFEPVEYLMGLYTDGGIVDLAPLSQAIEAGADDILVISTQHDVDEGVPKNGLDVFSKIMDAMSNEILSGDLGYSGSLKNDIEKCNMINRLIGCGVDSGHNTVKVNVISPSEPLGDSLDFDPVLIKMGFELGYEDAREFFKDTEWS